METEIPAMLRAREAVELERFTFHSSRMRMKKVTTEELAAMDADSDRCAAELADARVDVLGYACLVAIMSMGQGYHRQSQARLQRVTEKESGDCIPVVTSAGALVDSLKTMEARKIAMVAPYVKALTCMVADYIEAEGIGSQRISIEDVRRLWQVKEPVMILDVRTKRSIEGTDTQAQGAVRLLPDHVAERAKELGLDKEDWLIAYCA